MAPDPSGHTRRAFGKPERLSSKKTIDALFLRGQVIRVPGFRLHWMQVPPGPAPAQVTFGVPKKRFRKAVDRNRARRLMREAYRLHKQPVYNSLEAAGIRVALAFIFTGRELLSYRETEDKIILILQRLIGKACGKP